MNITKTDMPAVSCLSLPILIAENERKFNLILFGASKGFINALKAFIKPFEVQQRRVKIKI